MKKILLAIVSLIVSIGMNAQGIEILKTTNGTTTTVASYTNTTTDKYKAVLKKTPTEVKEINGHEYVTIGDKKWATMNVGATSVATNAITSYGNYYAWGSTDVYCTLTVSGNGITANWKYAGGYIVANAPYYNSQMGYYTKYTGSTGDNISTLENLDDVARQQWGGSWRMPTAADFTALADACNTGGSTYTVTTTTTLPTSKGIYKYEGSGITDYKVAGLFFHDGTNTIFFPAAGYIDGTTLTSTGGYSCYWSSSLSATTTNASCLFYGSSFANGEPRNLGFTVRPVSD